MQTLAVVGKQRRNLVIRGDAQALEEDFHRDPAPKIEAKPELDRRQLPHLPLGFASGRLSAATTRQVDSLPLVVRVSGFATPGRLGG